MWNFNDEAGYSQVLHLDVPRSVVPGSERGTLLVAGGMALPGAGVGAGHGRQPSLDDPAGLEPQQETRRKLEEEETAAEDEDDTGLQQPLPIPGVDSSR